MRCALKNLIILCVLFPTLALSQNVNCPPVDDNGGALTGSARSGGDVHSCTYRGAGECQYFADGSFSSGSSDCPQGLPDQAGATTSAPPSPPATQAPPPPPPVTTTQAPTTPPPPPPPTVTSTVTTPVVTTSSTSVPTTFITITTSSSVVTSSSSSTAASSTPAGPAPSNAAGALTGSPVMAVVGLAGMVMGIHLF